MAEELAFCGSKSGRDCDKVKELGLKAVPGPGDRASRSWRTAGCSTNARPCIRPDVLKDTLDADIISGYYPQGDFHSVYHGRILRCYKRLVKNRDI